MSEPPAYCFDTSSLLEAAARSYPQANFPAFWTLFEGLIAEGRAVICDAVLRELADDSNKLPEWIKAQKNFVVPFDREQEDALKRVMREYPKLARPRRNEGGADGFVVALAMVRKLIVVNEEGPGAAEGPKSLTSAVGTASVP